MAFSFTPLPNYVFDQVLSFTNMNVLKDNQQNIHDSLDTEHEFTDGIHRRITMGSNIVINPTATRGNDFWWGDGAGLDPDPEYANPPVWDYVHDGGAVGSGPFWKLTSLTTSTQGDVSEKRDMTAGVNLVISGEIELINRSAGSVALAILCYDAGGNHLLTIPVSISASTSGFQKFEATGTTPANTTYIRIWKWVNALTCDLVAIRKIKVEKGTVATTYSDEASMPQYLSARYRRTGALSIPNNSTTIMDYNAGPAGTPTSATFDDPGTDRVTTGAAWKFTADRYMKLRVSAQLHYGNLVGWNEGERALLRLWKNGAQYSELDEYRFPATPVTAPSLMLQGSDLIELNKGDYFDIRAFQDSGAPAALFTSAFDNYVSIEEIS